MAPSLRRGILAVVFLYGCGQAAMEVPGAGDEAGGGGARQMGGKTGGGSGGKANVGGEGGASAGGSGGVASGGAGGGEPIDGAPSPDAEVTTPDASMADTAGPADGPAGPARIVLVASGLGSPFGVAI